MTILLRLTLIASLCAALPAIAQGLPEGPGSELANGLCNT